MMNQGTMLCVLFLTALVGLCWAKDVPCMSRLADTGYYCVCNATYCDKQAPLTKLPSGKFYHIKTSNVHAGFHRTKGKFDSTSTFTPTLDARSSNLSSDVYVWVNASVQYQEFIGVGASLTDISGTLLSQIPTGAYDNLVQSFYGDHGMEFSTLRLPIGDSDFSLNYYSYDDVDGDINLDHFNLTEMDYQYKIPFIRAATNASKRNLKTFWSTWSTPPWMKTSNSQNQGYVLNKYLPVWTQYIQKFLEAYKAEGIVPWAITTGNEATLPLLIGPLVYIPNTLWMPTQVRFWVKNYLGPMLKQNGFENVTIMALDDERPFLNWWADRLFSDNETAQYVQGMAVHFYLDTNTTTNEMVEFRRKYPDKFILYTESSLNNMQTGGSFVELGSWSRAYRYIINIFQNFCNEVAGYTDWNVALDPNGGPVGPAGFRLDAPAIINVTSGEFYKQPVFYVLGHFSKFIPPGARRVQVLIKQETTDAWNEECTAELPPYENPASRVPRDASEPKQFPDFSEEEPWPTRAPDPNSTTVTVLATNNPDGSHTVIAYNPRFEPVILHVTDTEKGTFHKEINAQSLNTFVYW